MQILTELISRIKNWYNNCLTRWLYCWDVDDELLETEFDDIGNDEDDLLALVSDEWILSSASDLVIPNAAVVDTTINCTINNFSSLISQKKFEVCHYILFIFSFIFFFILTAI